MPSTHLKASNFINYEQRTDRNVQYQETNVPFVCLMSYSLFVLRMNPSVSVSEYNSLKQHKRIWPLHDTVLMLYKWDYASRIQLSCSNPVFMVTCWNMLPYLYFRSANLYFCLLLEGMDVIMDHCNEDKDKHLPPPPSDTHLILSAWGHLLCFVFEGPP